MRLKILIAALTVFTILAAGTTVFLTTSKSVPVSISERDATQTEIDAAARCLEQPETVACVEKLSSMAVASGNVKVFIDQMRYLNGANETVLAACHRMLHDFGEELAYAFGVDTLFKLQYPDCTFAFYHGVIWAHTSEMSFEELRTKMPDICSPFIEKAGVDNDASRECIHGIGHLLWEKAPNNDLSVTLEACTAIGAIQLYEPCVIGATMQIEETIIGDTRGILADWDYEVMERVFGSRDPDSVIKKYGEICAEGSQTYLRIGCTTGRMLLAYTLWQEDTSRVFGICEDLTEEIELSQCHTYTGAVVMENGQSDSRRGWDPAVMAKMCDTNITTEAAIRCGVLVMYSLFRISEPMGEEFCRNLKESSKPACELGRKRSREYLDGLKAGTSG